MKSASWSVLSLGYGAGRLLRNCTIALSLCASASFAENLTIVALGDSLTQGYGLPVDDGFVPQLQGWLDGQGADVTVVNAGVSGDTTAGGASRLEWSLAGGADALIVNLGGNDLLRGLDPAGSRANLAKILEGAKARDLPVLLVGLTAPGNYGPAYKSSFETMFSDLAAQYNTLLIPDFFAALKAESDDPAALGAFMQADGIHPNATGVAKIVDAIGPQVVALIAVAKP